MHRFVVACAAASCLGWWSAAVRPASAQTWNDARSRDLVLRATELRQRQLADTGLSSYAATAHGYVTFLAQVGEGFPDPPKIVRADELALEVYWRAPNYSKQWIVGRRDTLLLPTDINYHRDHLGVVQNNFPNIIRLGEGDEVRDVPHPASAAGLAAYDYAIRDSLRMEIPGRVLDVYEVSVRPKDERSAAAVGAIFISRDDAQIVRMAFSFTRAALLDRYLEDVSVVLENALINSRFWLPRRQEIEIRRTGTWMDFPARGIIRGRWEICCYQVNQPLPAEANAPGPEIVLAPPARRRAHVWPGGILDSLPPEVRAATDADVQRVQDAARALVREAALARATSTTLSARGIGELARITRAEGLSLGAGVRRRLGHGLLVDAGARFGLADHEPKGTLGVAWEKGDGTGIRLTGWREYRDARDAPEASSLANSLAAQEFGTDYTEPFDARGVELRLERRRPGSLHWTFSAGWQSADSVGVAARPTNGHFHATIPAFVGEGARAAVRLERPALAWVLGFTARAEAELRAGRLTSDDGERRSVGRLAGSVELERPVGAARLRLRTFAGLLTGKGTAPPQDLFYAGGPLSAPGYAASRFAAQSILTQRVEWAFPVAFPTVSLGRWGRSPSRAMLVPYVHAVVVGRGADFRPAARGTYPAAGVALQPFFELLRLDVARGFRDGKWSMAIDITRDFWRIL